MSIAGHGKVVSTQSGTVGIRQEPGKRAGTRFSLPSNSFPPLHIPPLCNWPSGEPRRQGPTALLPSQAITQGCGQTYPIRAGAFPLEGGLPRCIQDDHRGRISYGINANRLLITDSYGREQSSSYLIPQPANYWHSELPSCCHPTSSLLERRL